MTRLLKFAGATAIVLAALLLWQRYGLAIALSDGAWFCFGS